MRASAMISAVPCIATLVQLEEVADWVPPGKEGELEIHLPPLAYGRVLFQNDLSLSYWGRLSTKVDSGVG